MRDGPRNIVASVWELAPKLAKAMVDPSRVRSSFQVRQTARLGGDADITHACVFLWYL